MTGVLNPAQLTSSGDFTKQLEAELGETAEKRRNGLSQMRQLLQKLTTDDQLFKPRSDDEFLLRFLRARDFDAENATNLLVKYYQMKLKYKRWFYPDNKQQQLYKEMLGTGAIQLCPKLASDGSLVLMCISDVLLSKFGSNATAVLLSLVIDYLSGFPAVQISGLSMIYDTNHSTVDTVRRVEFESFDLTPKFMQTAAPVKFRRVTMANVAKIFLPFIQLGMKLFPSDLTDRTTVESGHDKTLELFGPENLSQNLGGQLTDVVSLPLTQWLIKSADQILQVDREHGYPSKVNADQLPNMDDEPSMADIKAEYDQLQQMVEASA